MQTSILDRCLTERWGMPPVFGERLGTVFRPFWLQNWSQVGPKAIKNRKNIDSKTNFEVDIIFGSISDPILINFGTEIASNFDLILE